MAEVVFWAAVAVAAYVYVGYGTVVWALARLRPRRVTADAIQPRVTVVIAAHNEEQGIAGRIEDLLRADYPADRLEILVGSDGSTDGTVAAARRFEPRVRVVGFDQRRGKAAVLNDLVPTATGAIVVFADARQRFHPKAIAALVANFADPAVGAVSGELVLIRADAPEAAVEGTSLYWDIEKQIRLAESRVDSTVGVTGAIYAIRHALFEPIPRDVILDDVVVPMRIVRRGYRVLFEPLAQAYDRQARSDRHEFARKTRTIAGNFQLLWRERWLLSPRRNRLWWQTVSHKVLRLLLPVCYAVAFAASLQLRDQEFFRWVLAGQALLIVAAVIGGLAPAVRRAVPVVAMPYAVGFLSWATIVGFARFVSGQQRGTWEREPTAPSGDGAAGSKTARRALP